MRNVNIGISTSKLDGTKPYMGMAFIDSYSDVLLKELKLADIDPKNPDGDHWDNYFAICPACKLPVVDSSIVPDSGGICDHCVNKAKGVTHPDPEPTMTATLTDSWGDKLILYLTVDEQMGGTAKFETADFFIPCAHCGNPVLNQSVEKHSDCCIRCETGNYTMSPVTYIKSYVGTGPTREDMLNMLLIHQLPEDLMDVTSRLATEKEKLNAAETELKEIKQLMVNHPSESMKVETSTQAVVINQALDMETRIDIAMEAGELAFWDVIARSFPEAVSGDYLMEDLKDIFRPNVQHWLDNNIPTTWKDGEGEPEEWTEDMRLHYPGVWHLHQTGGGCMVVTSDNVVVAGEHRYIGLTSENVCFNVDTFNEDEWLQVEQEIKDGLWSFGDNPCALMNMIDELFGGNCLWDTGHLFDDIMTIGKSGKC
jgi:hypothetical protein